MKRSAIVVFGILVSCFGCILAQSDQGPSAQVVEARRRVAQPPKITRFDKPVSKVPMVGTKTLPLVEIKINGKGPYKFLLDTGANVTMLQTRVSEELRLPVLRPGVASQLVRVESIQIGDTHFLDLVAGAKAWDEDIDGILGFGLFADSLLTIDYPAQKLVLKKGTLAPANGKDIFTYGLDNRCPTLGITIGNERLDILVDTGARQAVVITSAIASKLRFKNELVEGPILFTFHTAPSRARTGRLAGDINIGIHAISGPLIHVWDDVPVIGSDLLKDFVITFDQKNMSMRVSV